MDEARADRMGRPRCLSRPACIDLQRLGLARFGRVHRGPGGSIDDHVRVPLGDELRDRAGFGEVRLVAARNEDVVKSSWCARLQRAGQLAGPAEDKQAAG